MTPASSWSSVVLMALLAVVSPRGLHAEVVEVDAAMVKDLTDAGVPILFAGTVSWCGHCSALKKVWDELARSKLARSGSYTVARADCGAHESLCHDMGVYGYPTIVFVDGKGRKSKYKGLRQAKPIEAYVRRMLGPDVHEVRDAPSWERLSFEDEATFLLAPGDDAVAEQRYAEACVQVKAHAVCAKAVGEQAEAIARKAPGKGKGHEEREGGKTDGALLAVYKDGKLQRVGLDGTLAGIDLTEGHEALEAHMLANRFPLVTEIKPETYSQLVSAGRPVAIAAYDPYWKGKDKWIAALTRLADERRFSDALYFGRLDGIQWHDFTKQYGVGVDDLPRVFVVDGETKVHWYNATIDVQDRRALRSWLNAVLDGEEPAKGGSLLDRIKNFFDDHLPGLSQSPIVVLVLLGLPLIGVWYMCIAAGGDEEHHLVAAAAGRDADADPVAGGDDSDGSDDAPEERDGGHIKRD